MVFRRVVMGRPSYVRNISGKRQNGEVSVTPSTIKKNGESGAAGFTVYQSTLGSAIRLHADCGGWRRRHCTLTTHRYSSVIRRWKFDNSMTPGRASRQSKPSKKSARE